MDLKLDREISIIQNAIQEHDLYAYIGEYQGEDFLIVDSWDALEKIQAKFSDDNPMNIDYGFDDEYETCGRCGKIICTTPSHYGWTPDFIVNEYGYTCNDCICIDDIIDSYVNNPRMAISATQIKFEELEKEGFKKINMQSYESGCHEGMNDNPSEVFEKLKSEYEEIIFTIDNTSQFYVEFSVWAKNEDEDEY